MHRVERSKMEPRSQSFPAKRSLYADGFCACGTREGLCSVSGTRDGSSNESVLYRTSYDRFHALI